MLTGIELMLKRMESHPEEFVGVSGGCSKEWYAVFNPVVPYLTDEEKIAVNAALVRAYREHFTAQTMKMIAGEDVLSKDERYNIEGYTHSLASSLNGTSSHTLTGAVRNSASVFPLINNAKIITAAQTIPSAFGAVPVTEGLQP